MTMKALNLGIFVVFQGRLLKQSNFVKREVGYPPFQIILHFLYMLIMQKRDNIITLSRGNLSIKDLSKLKSEIERL